MFPDRYSMTFTNMKWLSPRLTALFLLLTNKTQPQGLKVMTRRI
jgi:hypothetical protein